MTCRGATGPKLLDKYTQTSGSGQQRPSAASDPSADVFFPTLSLFSPNCTACNAMLNVVFFPFTFKSFLCYILQNPKKDCSHAKHLVIVSQQG